MQRTGTANRESTLRSRVAAWAIGLVAAAALSGCSVNPATGERIFTLYSWDQETQLGAQAFAPMVQEYGGEVSDPVLRDFTTRVGLSLVPHVEDGVPELPWSFTLLDSDVINAFALPGGKVFMSRGLAEQFTSEAEFAAVIGHEIGHVTARHGNQRMSQQAAFTTGLTIGALAVDAAGDGSKIGQYGKLAIPALNIGGNVVLLSYGRDQELEADMLGVRYMVRAGYDPIGALGVQQLLKQASGGAGGGAFGDLLATHPSSDSRIDQIQSLLRGQYAYTQNNPEFREFGDRYAREFLSRLSALPSPEHPAPGSRGALMLAAQRGHGHDPALAVAGGPMSWCWHCINAN